jgi:hypothetical protein
MEVAVGYILAVAVVTAAVGWVWLLVAAFSAGWGWGIGTVLFPPVGLLFIPLRWSYSNGPASLLLLAGLLAGASQGLAYHERLHLFRERDRLVDGERHLHLTGWAKKDYSVLQQCTDVVQLYLANPDVTDETLHYLEGMSQLQLLDLDNTKVSDEGLATIARLPALRKLRLRNTAVTEAGFRKHLQPLPNLMELTVPRAPGSPNGVNDRTRRAWITAKPGRALN